MNVSYARIQIDRVVLTGLELTTERSERVRSLLAEELGELLAGGGFARPSARGELDRLETPTLQLSASPGDGELASGLAHSIAAALGRLGSPGGDPHA